MNGYRVGHTRDQQTCIDIVPTTYRCTLADLVFLSCWNGINGRVDFIKAMFLFSWLVSNSAARPPLSEGLDVKSEVYTYRVAYDRGLGGRNIDAVSIFDQAV